MLCIFSMSTSYAYRNQLQNIIKLNPYGMFNGPIPFNSEYRAQYERIVRSDIAYYVSLSRLTQELFLDKSVLYKETVPWSLKYKIGGMGFGTGIRKYLTTYYYNAPKGAYISPNFQMFYSKFESGGPDQALIVPEGSFDVLENDYINVYYFTFNTNVGYQFLINKAFIIDIFVGVGFKASRWNYSPTVDQYQSVFSREFVPENGVKAYYGFDMGFAF